MVHPTICSSFFTVPQQIVRFCIPLYRVCVHNYGQFQRKLQNWACKSPGCHPAKEYHPLQPWGLTPSVDKIPVFFSQITLDDFIYLSPNLQSDTSKKLDETLTCIGFISTPPLLQSSSRRLKKLVFKILSFKSEFVKLPAQLRFLSLQFYDFANLAEMAGRYVLTGGCRSQLIDFANILDDFANLAEMPTRYLLTARCRSYLIDRPKKDEGQICKPNIFECMSCQ